MKKSYAIFIFILLASLSACGNPDMAKAKKMLDEGFTAMKEGQQNADDAEKRLNQITDSKTDLIADHDKVTNLAKEASGLYEKASTKFHEAAKKADEASKLKVDDWYREYLTTVAQLYNKKADAADIHKEMADIYNDFNPNNAQERIDKLQGLADRESAVTKEHNELLDKVNKMEEKYKDKLVRL